MVKVSRGKSNIRDGHGEVENFPKVVEYVNLKIKGLPKWEATSVYLISITIATQDAQIQTEAGTAFWLGEKAMGIN